MSARQSISLWKEFWELRLIRFITKARWITFYRSRKPVLSVYCNNVNPATLKEIKTDICWAFKAEPILFSFYVTGFHLYFNDIFNMSDPKTLKAAELIEWISGVFVVSGCFVMCFGEGPAQTSVRTQWLSVSVSQIRHILFRTPHCYAIPERKFSGSWIFVKEV